MAYIQNRRTHVYNFRFYFLSILSNNGYNISLTLLPETTREKKQLRKNASLTTNDKCSASKVILIYGWNFEGMLFFVLFSFWCSFCLRLLAYLLRLNEYVCTRRLLLLVVYVYSSFASIHNGTKFDIEWKT